MNYLACAFKDLKYARNLVFCWNFARDSEILKSGLVVFLTLYICRKIKNFFAVVRQSCPLELFGLQFKAIIYAGNEVGCERVASQCHGHTL